MAKSLKYWYEFADDLLGNTKRIEIYEEGFVGDETELIAGSTPLSKTYNKDVGEKYLGGVVQMVVNIEANSTDEFQAINFNATNYGDIVIRHLIDDVVQFNAIIVPFEGSDIDLPSGYFNVSLGAECGLNQLKNITYSHSGTRKKVIQIIKECLSEIGYVDTFPIKVLDNTQCFALGELTGVDYWETYIEDANFEGLSCLEVINQLKQVYNEIVFSDKAWFIRNVEEISRTDSNLLTYDWSTLTQSSATYARPTETIQRTAGGQFGRLFSQQNIRVSKPKSALANIFPQGDMVDDTGWTYAGSAGLFLVIADGVLTNNRATFFTPTAVGADGSYIQSPLITFYPFQEWFDTREKERLQIRGKATKGAYIKNLRFQILAQAEGQTYFLTTEGTWYTYVSGYGTPIYTRTYTADNEFVIDIPQPPYVTSSILTSADKLSFGEFGYFNGGGDYLIPDTNIAYNLYIRVMYPERIHDEPPMSGDEVYGVELEADIDYLHVQKVDISGVVENGFNRNFGVPETKDRKIDFSVSIGVGYPSYPSGLDCLFVDSGSIDQVAYYGRHDSLTSLPIDEHIAYSYLDVLANRLSFYQGTIKGDLEFTDLISIDSVKYRIHNLSHDSRRNMSTVKLVELDSTASTLTITPIIQLDEETIRTINDEITKTLGTNTPLRFVDKNFEETILSSGERALKLRDDFKIRTLFSDEMFLRAASDGVITDVAEDTAGNYTLTKPAKDGTYALLSDITDTAWLLNGNALSASKGLGTTTAQDWTLIHTDATVATVTSDSIDLVVDLNSTGNITIEKGNPRLRLRDTSHAGHTLGFDIHVSVDEFLIDDNTHTKNIFRNYLNSSVHTTDLDSEVYNFKNGSSVNLHIKANGDVGKGTSSSYANFYVNETRTTGDRHAFEDWSNLALTDSNLGYCSFDAKPSISNSNNYQHYVGFQSRLIYNGSGNVTDYVHGYDTDITHSGSGTISSLAGIRIRDVKGVGTITNNYGLYINEIVRGGTNYAIYSDGGQSYHKGSFGIGAIPTRKLQVTSSAVAGTIAASFSDVLIENTSFAGITLRANDDSLSALRFNSPSGSNFGSALIVHDYTNSKLQIGTNKSGGEVHFMFGEFSHGATLNSTGLGVGVTSPSYKLDVTGTGHFTGVVTFDTAPSSLQDATSSNHLVRYSQWIAATAIKYLPTAVKTVSLTNITLSGTQTVNGVALVGGDRILVAGQTSGAENGVWVVDASTWTRATDSDTDGELRGYIVSVSNGTYAGYKYINTNASTITVGTTAITYSEFSNNIEIDPVFTAWRDTTRTANTFWAAPNGSNGVATWRALAVADVPTLNQSTTGSAATLTTARTISATSDISWSVTFDGSANVTAAATLATVATAGTYRSVTINNKGLVTSGTNPSIALGSEVSGVLPIANGGTGSATQNFVDLTTTQTVGGIKTFSGALTAQSLTASGGTVTAGNFSAYGVTYNTLASSIIQSGQQLYFAFKPLIFRASQYVFDRGNLVIGGNTSGLPADFDFGTERLQVNGNIRYSGTLKPSNTAGTSGQALLTDGTNDTWTTLTTSHISNLSSYTGFDARYFTETEIIAGYQPLDATLTSLAALAVSTGIMVQTTGDSQFVLRSITGTTNRVTVANGNGGAGNPTIDIASTYVGQTSITTLGTITTGTWNGTSISDTYISSASTWNAKQDALSGTGFVKISGTTISYDNSTYLTTSVAASTYQPLLPSGTAGQFLVKDSLGNNNFMNLELLPQGLTHKRIAVGDSQHYLSEELNFEYRESRFIAINRFTDPLKYLGVGMYGNSNNSFIEANGGTLTVRGDNGLIFSNFVGGGTLALTVDNDGRVGVTSISGGGSGTTSLTNSYIGYGSSTNTVVGNSKFTFTDGRIITINNGATSRVEVGRKISTENYGMYVTGGNLEFYTATGQSVDFLSNDIYFNTPAGVTKGGIQIDTNLYVVSSGVELNVVGDTALRLLSNSGEVTLGNSGTDSLVTIAGTEFKLHLDDSFAGAYTPANGDNCVLHYSTAKGAFILRKANTYNDGTRTYLIQ